MLRAPIAIVGCASPEGHDGLSAEPLWQSVHRFFREEAPWWACSFAFHFVLLSVVALLAGMMPARPFQPEVAFSVANAKTPEALPPEIDRTKITIPAEIEKDVESQIVEIDNIKFTKLGQNVLDNGKLDDLGPPQIDKGLSKTPTSSAQPGLPGAEAVALAWTPGPKPRIGTNLGTTSGGAGGSGMDNPNFKIRHGPAGPPTSLKRVAAALNWLARHQLADGSWSLQGYTARCRDKTCSGAGSTQADSAATSLALLPYLAAGRTHKAKGIYQKTISDGLAWLVRQQKPDGDLRCGATMYAHGLATITLCEVYGMTGDRSIGYAAQRAVDFLQAAQNKRTGGWRYQPGEEGDLSVTGWQIMALKSAQMAGLSVDAGAFQRARDYLAATSAGQGGSASASGGRGLFAYQPGALPNLSMTAVGLLCSQYLGARRSDPLMVAGTARLMANLPDAAHRDLYYWYYATQVMHNQPGTEWDVWNRRIRNLLVECQDREGCAAGSWDPQHPSPDPWGSQGGRLMTTCLATLTLEVYYRYIPLYKIGQE
jgi:hypothetical protein